MSVVVWVMAGDVKEGKKCRRLRVGAALSRRLSRRPLPARERELVGWAGEEYIARERKLGDYETL